MVEDYSKFRREELVVEKEIFVVKVRPDSLGYDKNRIASALAISDRNVVCPYVVGTPPKFMGEFDRPVYSWSLKHDEKGRPVRAFAKDDQTFVNLEGKILGDFGRPVESSSIWYDRKGSPVNALAKQRYVVDISGKVVFDFGMKVDFNEICRDKNGRPLSALADDSRTVDGKNGRVLGKFKDEVDGPIRYDGKGRPLAAKIGPITVVDVHGKVIWKEDVEASKKDIFSSLTEICEPFARYVVLGSRKDRVFDFGQPVRLSSIRYETDDTPVCALACDDQTILHVKRQVFYDLPESEYLKLRPKKR